MNDSGRDALLARVDERTHTIKEDVSEIKRHIQEQNGRIGALERWQARTLGAVGLAAVATPMLALKGGDVLKAVFG